MLQREKIPFALATLLGLLTWTVTRAIDHVLEAPLIKYTQVDRRVNGARFVSFDVENISATLYTNIEFVVLLREGKFVRPPEPWVSPVLPMLNDSRAPIVVDDSARFTFPELHPGGQLRIEGQVTEDAVAFLGMRHPRAAARLVRPSIQTWLVETELVLLLIIGVAGIGLAAAYVVALVKHPAQTPQERAHEKKTDPAAA